MNTHEPSQSVTTPLSNRRGGGGEVTPPILDISGILISSDLITEQFCCDLSACKGACCVEGDAGAPVTLDEVAEIEDSLNEVWGMMSHEAQAVVRKQGVAYSDPEGELVTSIVNGKDCAFTYYDELQLDPEHPVRTRCCLCALETACRKGKTKFQKPISCALYPIREKRFSGGLIGLNYHRWEICRAARERGKALGLPLYRFLREPLIRRFGAEWYAELEEVADILLR